MGYSGGKLAPLYSPELAHDAVHNMAEDGGDWLFEAIKRNTPVSYHGLALQYGGFTPSREPGTLRRSWYKLPATEIVSGLEGGTRVEIRTDDPIAPFVEYPTQPHIITPKLPGGMLVFRTWPTGKLVRTKIVHHPGTKGAHMVRLSVHHAEVEFEEITRPALEEWKARVLAESARANR